MGFDSTTLQVYQAQSFVILGKKSLKILFVIVFKAFVIDCQIIFQCSSDCVGLKSNLKQPNKKFVVAQATV